jgi:peptidoglycan/LPS O-acetylase OafA/YrhL
LQQNNWISPNISIYLNFMRVAAAEFVLIGHLFFWNKVHQEVIAFANYGVIIFFILSGMLISNSIFIKNQKGNYGFARYFIDRFARIYSGLIPSLFFILILDTVHFHFFPDNYLQYNSVFQEFPPIHDFTFQNFIGCLLMLQHFPIFENMSIGFGFGTGRSLWSLATEWWLYMLFGWLILSKKRNLTSLLVLIFFCIFPIAYLFSKLNHVIIAWFLGVAITLLMSSGYSEKIKKFKVPLLCIGILLFLFIFSKLIKIDYSYDNIYIVVLTASALLFIVNGLQPAGFGERLKNTIGFMSDYSFTLYLTHTTILAFAAAFPIINNFKIYFGVTFLLSNVIAASIAYYTEMKHKDLAKFLHQQYLTYKTTYSTKTPT